MTTLWALSLVLIAGFINGSFAAPTKYMHRWRDENIWFAFSFWAFLILPWLTILIMAAHAVQTVEAIPHDVMAVMLVGGCAFGLGQVAFATSFNYIGIGLAFVINISMGTAGTALIPILWHKGVWGTTYSYLQIIGIFWFIAAVMLGAAAGAARQRHRKHANTEDAVPTQGPRRIQPGKALLGISLAVLAGIGSIGQGVGYVWANPVVSRLAMERFHASELPASIVAWVIIFTAAWVPYMLYFLSLNLKNRSLSIVVAPRALSYWLITLLMGVGFWGSLIFFSEASNVIGGDLAPTIAWPIFMVFIILTSNFWGWKAGEWKDAGRVAGRRMWTGIALFIVAITIFSASSLFEPKEAAPPQPAEHGKTAIPEK